MNGGLINMAIVVITSGSQGILHMPGYRQMIAGINNYTYRHAFTIRTKRSAKKRCDRAIKPGEDGKRRLLPVGKWDRYTAIHVPMGYLIQGGVFPLSFHCTTTLRI
jgi:hypothetical protein